MWGWDLGLGFELSRLSVWDVIPVGTIRPVVTKIVRTRPAWEMSESRSVRDKGLVPSFGSKVIVALLFQFFGDPRGCL